MTEPISVLIVDDHPVLRVGVIACLREDPGIAVVGEADNGEEALGEAARLRPDLVLMDIRMPDRIAVIRRLVAALPQTRVLIWAMDHRPHDVERSVAAGARGYLLKSTTGNELLHGIRAVHEGALYFGEGVEYPPKPAAPVPLTKGDPGALPRRCGSVH